MSNEILGKVAAVNEAGDLITDIEVNRIADVPQGDSVSVRFGPHVTVGIHEADHTEPESTLLAVRGASGYLELTIVGLSLSEMLGIGPGEVVEINW